jgi:hypothetical protein
VNVMAKRRVRGRPVLGGIAGFVFLLFLGVDLMLFGVVPFNSPLLTILPVVGIVLGVALGLWAPLGRRPSSPMPEPITEPAEPAEAAEAAEPVTS